MNLKHLEKALEKEPSFRIKQAKEAIFKGLIENWQEALFLPLRLRETLNKECSLDISAKTLESAEKNSVKILLQTKDSLKIEAVLIRHKDERNTVCVSSQAGCPLGCLFCATGRAGFKRSLEAEEIIEQVLFFARYLKKEGNRISNVVFMGMGEPFLNYDNFIEAAKIINDKKGFNIGARFISVSTVGIAEGIEKLAEEKMQINLAISLHAGNDKTREKIIPANKKYNIKKILEAVDKYIAKTKRQVMFEYVLLKGINDSDKDALELAKLIKKPLYFLNLISYNETGLFEASEPERVKKFKAILEKEGIKYSQRHSFGQDIQASCGQFSI